MKATHTAKTPQAPAAQTREATAQLDNRESTAQAFSLQAAINSSSRQAVQRQQAATITGSTRQVAQRQEAAAVIPAKNTTGLPDQLKAGVENLSGYSLDDVRVHYNSAKPAQLQAHAYAQGSEIHLAPGQEKHLPHEAWHVAQQKQGRVKATMQLKGVGVNDDSGLEQEADAMGARAAANSQQLDTVSNLQRIDTASQSIQLKEKSELQPGFNMIGETHTDYPAKLTREEESARINKALGVDIQYFQENSLKVNTEDKDYADPVHMRLEQIIAFALKDIEELNVKLQSVKGVDLAESISNVENDITLANKIISEIQQAFFKEEMSVEQAFENIKSRSLPIKVIEQLHNGDRWNAYLEDEREIDLLSPLQDKLLDYQFYLQDLEEENEPSERTMPNNNLATVRLVIDNLIFFDDKYKWRLPNTFKLYKEIKESGHYDKSEHFEFNVENIQSVLDEWDKIVQLYSIVEEIKRKEKFGMFGDVIEAMITRFSKLSTAIQSGMSADSQNRSILDVVKIRSIAMHEAAEKLAARNIAWKVGDLHIDDIRKLEDSGEINTQYTYLSKINFMSKYVAKEEVAEGIQEESKMPEEQSEKTAS